MKNRNKIIIDFAGDIDLARLTYNFLSSIHSLKKEVNIELQNGEILLYILTEVKLDKFKIYLRELLKNSLAEKKFENYKITEFEDTFIVGIPRDISEISSFVSCEICGHQLTSEEELIVHRRSHGVM